MRFFAVFTIFLTPFAGFAVELYHASAVVQEHVPQILEYEECSNSNDYMEKAMKTHLEKIRYLFKDEVDDAQLICPALSEPEKKISELKTFSDQLGKSLFAYVNPKRIDRYCVYQSLGASQRETEQDRQAQNRPDPTISGLSFYNCKEDSDGILEAKVKNFPPPCRSKALVETITHYTNKAIACFDNPEAPLDAAEIFALFNHESHFNINVVGRGGAGMGIGQLTTDGVQSGRRLRLAASPASSGHTSSKNITFPAGEACTLLLMHMDMESDGPKYLISTIINKKNNQPLSVAKPCQFMNPRTNPAKAIVFSIVNYQGAYIEAKNQLIKKGIRKPTDEQIKIVTRLIYNLGGKSFQSLTTKLETWPTDPRQLESALEAEISLDSEHHDYHYSSQMTQDARFIEKATNGHRCAY